MHGLGPLIIDNCVTGSPSVMRTSLLRLALPFPEPTDAAYHDHWLALCADVDGGTGILPDVVQNYQQHGANVIGEELGRSLVTRFAKLQGTSGGGLARQLDYLSQHRFGWSPDVPGRPRAGHCSRDETADRRGIRRAIRQPRAC
jgi:hypothetical protein